MQKKAKVKQFVIFRVDERGERFSLTLADWKSEVGMITLVFLDVGASTIKLGTLEPGNKIQDISGLLGNPSEIKHYINAALVCGELALQPRIP